MSSLSLTRPRESARQERTVERLAVAAVAELRVVGYDGLTVRNVARGAGVAPATAYTYFASREHLVTEVFWRRLAALPETELDAHGSACARVVATLTDLALLVADEPEVAAACSAAMLAADPDVGMLRDRIGAEMRRRLARALGAVCDPAVLLTLELAVSGALLRAGMGHLEYSDLPVLLSDVAGLVVGERTPQEQEDKVLRAVEYDPYAYEIHEDPYPTYERLREEAPLYFNAERGFYALSRHADVSAAFRASDKFSSTDGVSLDPAASGPGAARTASFLAMDPPRHTRMRALVSRAFTPKRIAELEDRVREIAVGHLHPALEQDKFDFITDFAGRLPMDVVCELLGVPVSERDELRRLSDLVVHREDGLRDIPPAGLDAVFALITYYIELVAARRAQPADDLTSALLEAEIDGDRLDDDDIVGFLFLMVVAGNETTTKLLGNAWYWAWRNPEERAKPFADPGRIAQWVEETLRYDASTQMLARTATQPVALHGGEIPAGGRVVLLIGSANRDPRVFDRPEVYDLDRPTPQPQLASFGFGRHHCLGAWLARLEARVALEELVRRVSDYEIDADQIKRVHSINVRGFAALPSTVALRERR